MIFNNDALPSSTGPLLSCSIIYISEGVQAYLENGVSHGLS